MTPSGDVTQHLQALQNGDDSAPDALWDEVYDELHRIAQRQLRRQRPGDTLNTTALVHEAYLKLTQSETSYEDRLHFYAVSATAMRHIIIDHARAKQRQKRGGDRNRTPLRPNHLPVHQRAEVLIDLDDALDRLADLRERLAKVVEYRFFGGMTEEEIADLLDLSPRTVRRDWKKAKAWLTRELEQSAADLSSL
jgi:RNA polymerase sigma factor (TIGR02999 family)